VEDEQDDRPDWQHDEMQSWEAHLEVWHRSEADPTQHAQLQQLQCGEEMDLSLRNGPDVVIRRVCSLQSAGNLVTQLTTVAVRTTDGQNIYDYCYNNNNNNNNGFVCIAARMLDYTISATQDSAYNRTQII